MKRIGYSLEKIIRQEFNVGEYSGLKTPPLPRLILLIRDMRKSIRVLAKLPVFNLHPVNCQGQEVGKSWKDNWLLSSARLGGQSFGKE